MTKQVLRERKAVDVLGCFRCQFYTRSDLFQLCTHKCSEYTVDGKTDAHTVQHMREEHGMCGPDKRLFLEVTT